MSLINEKLKFASTCPFCNMIRAFDGLKVDAQGDVEREHIRERMRHYGFGPISTILVDISTAAFEHGQVKEGWLNMTHVFNTAAMNHYADMGVVNAEKGKVDPQRVQEIVADLERFSDDGIADVLSLAKLQQVIFARDRDKVLAFHLDPAKPWLEAAVSETLSFFFRLFYAKVVSAGELTLIMLMFGYRDPLTRTRFIHTKQWGEFLSDGQLPAEYQVERSGVFRVFCFIQLILALQVALNIPVKFLSKAAVGLLVGSYTVFCAVSNRLREIMMKPFGIWVSAKRMTRSQVRKICEE